jgi:hypothetical protein
VGEKPVGIEQVKCLHDHVDLGAGPPVSVGLQYPQVPFLVRQPHPNLNVLSLDPVSLSRVQGMVRSAVQGMSSLDTDMPPVVALNDLSRVWRVPKRLYPFPA